MSKSMLNLAVAYLSIAFPCLALADMAILEDQALSEVSGQGGIYLSGDMSINEVGGPIENAYFGQCDDPLKRCGARAAFRLKEDGGWVVLDDLRGKFSFEGLTLKVRSINAGFGGDGALFNRDVIEVGLPDTVRYSDVRFKLATSSTARPTDPGFQQTDIWAFEMRGDVVMQGTCSFSLMAIHSKEFL